METNELNLTRNKNGWSIGIKYDPPLFVFNESEDSKNWLEDNFNPEEYYTKPEPQSTAR